MAANTTALPKFQIRINDSNPIWGYCGQTGHCEAGMVFSINAPTSGSNTFAAFQQLALGGNSISTTTSTSGYSRQTSSYSSTTAYSAQASSNSKSTTTSTATYSWQTSTAVYSWHPPMDHQISVGADGKLEYSPPDIAAQVGDTVTFTFNPKNHTGIVFYSSSY